MSVILILSFLAVFFISVYKKNKWVSILVFIHLLSISAGLLLDYRMEDSVEGILYALLICFYLYLIIAPWSNLRPTNGIRNDYGKNLKTYSNIILFMGVFSTLFFIPVVVVLYSLGFEADYFRNGGGMEVFFKSSAFPIPFKIFILISFMANISLIALPLHFYYLTKGANKLALFAFIASLAYVMRGLGTFSRSILLQYILLYGMFFLFFYKQIDKKFLRYLKIGVVIGAVAMTINFLSISNERFESGYSVNQTEYAQDKYKYVSDPVVVSLLDYLSQGYYNAYDLLVRYKRQTFRGQTTFGPILVLLNQYLGYPFSSEEYQNLRETLWPGRWWETFNGYVGYVVYDFGLIGSFLVTLLYFVYIKRTCRKNSRTGIGLSKLTWLMLFFQVPLHSIFYSALEGIVIPAIFFVVINFVFVGRQKRIKYSSNMIILKEHNDGNGKY